MILLIYSITLSIINPKFIKEVYQMKTLQIKKVEKVQGSSKLVRN